MLRKAKKRKPTPKGTRIGQPLIERKRKPGEKDGLFSGLAQERIVKLKYEYQRSNGTLFPRGAAGSDYWVALAAFNNRREEERRLGMQS